jgi:ferredoxin
MAYALATAQPVPAGPLRISPALCLAARGAGGAAAWCVRLCPAEAIAVAPPEAARPGPSVRPGRCDGCGLCVRACPTGAFDQPGAEGAPALASAVRAGVRPGADLWIRCGRAREMAGPPRAAPPEVEVPCLGAVGEGLLLEAAAAGPRSVRLDDRACGGCPRRRGMALARLAVRRTRRLAKLFGLASPLCFARSPGAWKRPERRTRRAFLLARREPAGPRSEPAFSPALRRVPGERRALAAALERLGEPAPCLLPAGAAALWAVSAAPACDGCGACAALCPTEALELKEGAGGSTLLHRPLWCTGCGACLGRCPRGALSARDPVPSLFLAVSELPLAAVARRVCALCGKPAAAGPGGELCQDCRLRRTLAASFSASRREGAR